MHTQGAKIKFNAKRGRPPKPPETIEDIMGPALKRRIAEVGEKALVVDIRTGKITGADARAGFPLGILRLWGGHDGTDPSGISEEQYQAGIAYTDLMHRHAGLQGFEVKRNPGSPQFVSVGGTSCAPEPDPSAVKRTTEQVRRCQEVLCSLSYHYATEGYRPGRAIMEVLYGVCLENMPAQSLSPRDKGNLRVALNALAKVLG